MPRGGFRPGSGRPKGWRKAKPAVSAETELEIGDQTPLAYLLSVMNDPTADPIRRDRAASVAAPFLHAKAGEVGKKGERAKAAEAAGSGKFCPAAPPKLVVNNK